MYPICENEFVRQRLWPGEYQDRVLRLHKRQKILMEPSWYVQHVFICLAGGNQFIAWIIRKNAAHRDTAVFAVFQDIAKHPPDWRVIVAKQL